MYPQQKPQNPQSPGESEFSLEEVIDFRAITNWLLHFWQLIWRKKWVVLACGLLFAVLSAAWVFTGPRSYSAGTSLLVIQNTWVRPHDEDRSVSLTQQAATLLPIKENLIKVAQRVDLLNRNDESLSPREKLGLWWFGLFNPPPSEKERLGFLVGALGDALGVESEWSSADIGVSWRDPALAYEIVQSAKDIFLELCHERDVAAIVDSIAVLEGHAAELRIRVDSTTEELSKYIDQKEAEQEGELREEFQQRRAQAERRVALATPRRNVAAADAPVDATVEQTMARLNALEPLIASAKRKVDGLTAAQQERVASLHAELAQLKVKYTDIHPEVVALKQRISVASQQTPEIRAAQAELQSLLDERTTLATAVPSALAQPSVPRAAAVTARSPLSELAMPEAPRIDVDVERDTELTRMEGAARLAHAQYESVQRQIESRKFDLELAQRAFKQRYKIVAEAEIPRSADKGRKGPVLGGLVAGMVFGCFLIVLLDLRRGVIVRDWQLAQAVALPIVADRLQLNSRTSADQG